jgi:hypothetical protein
MAHLIQDGGHGQRFVLTCDDCGAEIAAPTISERERERARLLWSTEGRDLCPACQADEWSAASP